MTKRRATGYKFKAWGYVLLAVSVVVFLFIVGPLKTKYFKPLSESTVRVIYVDHNSVDLFDQIPDEYIAAARNLRQVFSDRSVGQNINESLDCLAGIKFDGTYTTNWYDVKSACRRDYSSKVGSVWYSKTYGKTDYDNGTVPRQILFSPDPVKYSRANWTFVSKAGSWSNLTQDFIQTLAPAYIDSKDVLSYQFSYLNVTANDTIANPQTGFFANTASYDIYDLEDYISQHPGKTFIFWTSSLARSIGTKQATDFNTMMRQYALDHNKILFDVADIESHDPNGNPCYDNKDGVEYCTPNGVCENYADDNQNYPAICQDYTTEVDGGHLGSVSGAQIRIAKAYWVLMAQIAGWDPGQPAPTRSPAEPGGGTTNTPTPSPIPTAQPTATNTPTTPPTSDSLNFTATPACSSVTLNWSAVTNATGYFLDKCPDVLSSCGGKWTQVVVYKPILSYTDTNVVNNQVYSYRLYAYKSDRTFTPNSYQTVTPSCN